MIHLRDNKITTISGNSSDSSLESNQEDSSILKGPSYSEYAGTEKEILHKNKTYSKETNIQNSHDSSTTVNNATKENFKNLVPPHLNNKSSSNGTKNHQYIELSQFSTSNGSSVSMSDTVSRLKNEEQKASELDYTSLRFLRKRKNDSICQNATPFSSISSLPGLEETLTRNMELQNSLTAQNFETKTNDSNSLSNIGCSSEFPATQMAKNAYISINAPKSFSSLSDINKHSANNANGRSTYR